MRDLISLTFALALLPALSEGGPDPMDPASGAFLDTDLSELEALAHAAYAEEDWETAAERYLSYLSLQAGDAGNIYNLACCYGLMGEAELAGLMLERAWRAGFTDHGHIFWDPDFDPVREDPAFAEVVDRLGEEAQEREAGLGEEGFFTAESGFVYRARFPEDFDAEVPTPLLIGLHGLGDSPEGYIRLWEAFDDPDFIFAVPPALYPFSTGGEVGYSWFRWEEDSLAALELDRLDVDYVMTFLEHLQGEYAISEVYLLGFSQGCGMTWMTGLSNPEAFTGLIGFGGWLNTRILDPATLEASEGMRVFVAHGSEDRAVEYSEAEVTVETMQVYGIDVTFVPFQGGHSLDREVLLQAQEWMGE